MEQVVTTPTGSRRNEDIALDLLKFVAAPGIMEGHFAGRGLRRRLRFQARGAGHPDLALYSKCLGVGPGQHLPRRELAQPRNTRADPEPMNKLST